MENKKEIINNLLCMACLCVGRSIHEVKNEKLKKYYMNTLSEIPLNNIKTITPIICWECHAVLCKILSFREQVKDSYRILQTYTENLNECLLTDVSRTPRLKVHINDPITIVPNLNEVKIEQNEDMKIENGICTTDISDAEPEVAIQTVLCDVKRDRRKKTSLNRSVKNRQNIIEKDPIESDSDDFKHIKLESIIDTEYVTKEEINTSNETTTNGFKKGRSRKKNHNKTSDSKSKSQNGLSNVDDFKIELNGEYNMKEDLEDMSDFNIEEDDIQSLLEEVRSESEDLKSSKQETVKTKNISRNIITIELTYDEMQAERTNLSQGESFLNAQYKCDTCLMTFKCVTSKTAHHSKKHAVNGDFICSICKTIISSVEAFTAHYKRHMRRYECAICNKRTADIKAMYQHLYTKHDVTLKKYKCNICGKVSKSLDSHRYHVDSHKARVACAQCDKTFSHRAGLMNHRLAVHELQNEFPCTLCDKVFRWKTSLKRHLEKHNDNKETSVNNKAFCASCGIGFSSVCSFQRHLRNSLKHVTHDQLKFICDHCNQRFADKTKLRDHIEEKHLHRTFHCHICLKPSKNRVGLEQHVRSVHRGRPNNRMCHHCGKGFPTKVQLESHIRTHTGERPFMCEYCPTTFSQQSNLYKHHRQVHLNIKSKRYLCKKRKPDGNQTGDPQQHTLPIMQYLPDNAFSL